MRFHAQLAQKILNGIYWAWTHQAISNSRMHIARVSLSMKGYQDGMVQLQSVNQRSKKQAKLSMPPQWGQTLYQVASLFKKILSLMELLCRNI